eukprot:m.13040 g.13040  ORF g.13040 m.13040 type:complete len:645 (+) comp5895_c0_seq1:467-2401(+)
MWRDLVLNTCHSATMSDSSNPPKRSVGTSSLLQNGMFQTDTSQVTAEDLDLEAIARACVYGDTMDTVVDDTSLDVEESASQAVCIDERVATDAMMMMSDVHAHETGDAAAVSTDADAALDNPGGMDLLALPREILVNILVFCTHEEIECVAKVCTALRAVCQDPELWRRRYVGKAIVPGISSTLRLQHHAMLQHQLRIELENSIVVGATTGIFSAKFNLPHGSSLKRLAPTNCSSMYPGPFGAYICCVSGDSRSVIVFTSQGVCRSSFQTTTNIHAVLWSPDGHYIAVLGSGSLEPGALASLAMYSLPSLPRAVRADELDPDVPIPVEDHQPCLVLNAEDTIRACFSDSSTLVALVDHRLRAFTLQREATWVETRSVMHDSFRCSTATSSEVIPQPLTNNRVLVAVTQPFAETANLTVFNLTTRKEEFSSVNAINGAFHAFATNPQEDFCVVVLHDAIQFYHLNGQGPTSFATPPTAAAMVSWSPDGRSCVVMSHAGRQPGWLARQATFHVTLFYICKAEPELDGGLDEGADDVVVACAEGAEGGREPELQVQQVLCEAVESAPLAALLTHHGQALLSTHVWLKDPVTGTFNLVVGSENQLTLYNCHGEVVHCAVVAESDLLAGLSHYSALSYGEPSVRAPEHQ